MNVKCGHCEKSFDHSKQYAYYAEKYYCSSECYDTLFLPCLECKSPWQMDALTNLKEHGEQLCNPCYNKKHGLTVMTISSGVGRTRPKVGNMEEIIESVKFLNSLLDKSDETLGAFARVEILRLNRLVRNYAAQQSVQRTCLRCGASLTSGTTPKDGKSHCPSCGASR